MKEKIKIGYDAESISIEIGDKRFYGSEDINEFAEIFADALKYLGYEDVEVEECY